jgi:nucleoid DNA-binding protein
MATKRPGPIKEKQTKSQILSAVAEATGLSKKDVQAVLGATRDIAGRHLGKNGSGEFTVPEINVKLVRKNKPARKAGMARNPFTGEMVKVAARPASFSVGARPLKSLKDLAVS